jgi:hypothetical protein
MSTSAIYTGLGLSLIIVGIALAGGARAITSTYEQRHGVQAMAVMCFVGAVWCFVYAAERAE